MLRLAQHNIAVCKLPPRINPPSGRFQPRADSPHTAIDAAPGGINDWLASMLPTHGIATKSQTVAQPIRGPVPAGFEGAGYGRVMELAEPVRLDRIARAYAAGLNMKHVMVARPRGPETMIRSVAVCAGSGSDVLKDADVDLVVTGEMTHHVALRLTMLGKSVLTVFHSNSERGFLEQVLRPQLEGVLRKEDGKAEVLVSEEDADPFEIWEARAE